MVSQPIDEQQPRGSQELPKNELKLSIWFLSSNNLMLASLEGQLYDRFPSMVGGPPVLLRRTAKVNQASTQYLPSRKCIRNL